eukprot:gene22183-30423_t
MIAYSGHGDVGEVGFSGRGLQSKLSYIDLHPVFLSRGQNSRFHGQQSLEILTYLKIVLAAATTPPPSWQSSLSCSSAEAAVCSEYPSASSSSSSSSCSPFVDNHSVRYQDTVSACTSSNPFFVLSIPTLAELPPSLVEMGPQYRIVNYKIEDKRIFDRPRNWVTTI